jgi:hypothetical protein
MTPKQNNPPCRLLVGVPRVEENQRRRIRGSLLGLAQVVALAGVMMFGLAIHRVFHLVYSKAAIAFLMGAVAWIIAGRLYAAWRYLSSDENGVA